MAPYADDAPSSKAKQLVDDPVSLFVPGDLKPPVSAIVAGHSAMPAAAMPKTTVHKNGKTLATKREVWTTWQRLMSAPTGDAGGTNNGSQLEFGGFVAFRAYSCHD